MIVQGKRRYVFSPVGTSRCDVRAACSAQLLRMPASLGHSFRPLLRGRGRRSAPSLPSRKTRTRATQGGSRDAPLPWATFSLPFGAPHKNLAEQNRMQRTPQSRPISIPSPTGAGSLMWGSFGGSRSLALTRGVFGVVHPQRAFAFSASLRSVFQRRAAEVAEFRREFKFAAPRFARSEER